MGTNVVNLVDEINRAKRIALLPYLREAEVKLTISSSDVNYIEYLAQNGKMREAKQTLRNLESVSKIISDQINDTKQFIRSLEA